MRVNFSWIDDPELKTLNHLDSRLFFSGDAEANGIKAGSEVFAATNRFVTGTREEYRPLFFRIRPAEAIRSAGVILHKQLEFMDAAPTETDRIDQVLELLEFLSFDCNKNTKLYSFLMAAEYFDFLQYRGGGALAYAADKLIQLKRSSRILGHLWGPEVSLASYGDFCLYAKIKEAVDRLPDGEAWLKSNLNQNAMLKAYQTGAYPELNAIMTRKTRGKALESDLGM